MKHTLAILSLTGLLVTLTAANAADTPVKRNYPTPLAEEARAKPAPFPEDEKGAHWEAERTRYSVLIGMHDFATLDKEAAAFMRDYSARKINGDEFVSRMFSIVPLKSGSSQLEDLKAWTQANPKSYAAWYVLGRQYLELAAKARGNQTSNRTSQERFEEAKKYAALAYRATMESLPLYGKPVTSYITLIHDEALGGPFVFNPGKAAVPACNVKSEIKGGCRVDQNAFQDEVLDAAIKVDPDMMDVYSRYFWFNVPRWGGSFERLTEIYDQARKSGKVSTQILQQMHAELLWRQASELVFHGENLGSAADLYIQAYEVNPKPGNLRWLYKAAFAAGDAGDKAREIQIFTRIIGIRDTEYEAYFNRAMLSDEVYQDHDRMFSDLAISAKLGYVYAQNNIGYDYMTGIHGYPVNLQEARKWLVLAANQGYQHSKDKIAVVDTMIAKQQAQEKGPQRK
jgi:hypothetical protein